jgi:hypothetical protein
MIPLTHLLSVQARNARFALVRFHPDNAMLGFAAILCYMQAPSRDGSDGTRTPDLRRDGPGQLPRTPGAELPDGHVDGRWSRGEVSEIE